jgi:hypothetical protein
MHLRGADFAVYDAAMALTAHSTTKRILSASKATLARMTGYSERTVGFARGRLVTVGWFLPLRDDWKEDQRRTGAAGAFRTPEFEVIDHQAWAEFNPGKCPTVYLSSVHGPTVPGESEHGQTARAATADTVHGPTIDTVHGQQVHKALQTLSLKEKPARKKRGHFENRKMTDPRFEPLKRMFVAEFERKSPGLKAPFNAGDGKMLQDLLQRQAQATAEDLVRWLKNAFASDDTPPLRPMFRMREFCAQAEKYAVGPLKRGGATLRSATVDEKQAAQIDGLVY